MAGFCAQEAVVGDLADLQGQLRLGLRRIEPLAKQATQSDQRDAAVGKPQRSIVAASVPYSTMAIASGSNQFSSIG